MSYYKRSVDANEKEIIKSLRMMGASAYHVESYTDGFPDLVVGWQGETYIFEVKNRKGKNKLEESQKAFMLTWKGGKAKIVRDLDDILEVMEAADLTDILEASKDD